MAWSWYCGYLKTTEIWILSHFEVPTVPGLGNISRNHLCQWFSTQYTNIFWKAFWISKAQSYLNQYISKMVLSSIQISSKSHTNLLGPSGSINTFPKILKKFLGLYHIPKKLFRGWDIKISKILQIRTTLVSMRFSIS